MNDVSAVTLQSLQSQLVGLSKTVEQSEERKKTISILLFNGYFDHIMLAFTIALGAANLGVEVRIFFTWWGLAALRDPKKQPKGKNLMSKMMGFMQPKGASDTTLSKMHMAGMGTKMIKELMKKKNVSALEERFALCRELGVKMCACDVSMSMMGMTMDEFIDYEHLTIVGSTKFVADALGGTTLVI